jgi:hypothetical protein
MCQTLHGGTTTTQTIRVRIKLRQAIEYLVRPHPCEPIHSPLADGQIASDTI